MNRARFHPGLSLPVFLKQDGGERACEQALLHARWREGFVCPASAGRLSSTFPRGEQIYRPCSTCRHQTSLRAGTIFDNPQLPLTTWFLALYLLTQSKTNLAALELMRHLGVCYRTAWRLKHKPMQAMASREADRQLGGLARIVLSNLKRALDGTYHAFRFFKYANRYLDEAAWRFNRRFHLDILLPRLLVADACCGRGQNLGCAIFRFGRLKASALIRRRAIDSLTVPERVIHQLKLVR